MTLVQRQKLEDLILKLLDKKSQIALSEVMHAAGLSHQDASSRKAIQRMLIALVKREILQTHGVTRARVYSLKNHLPPSILKEVPISESSRKLLTYLDQPLLKRRQVGYNREFLNSYKPNKTEYLSQTDKMVLLEMGRSENASRPAGTYARHILNRLLIDLSWNSSRLEGNTYSLLETKRLIEQGKSVNGKDATEAQMILNHKRTIEFIVDSCDDLEITSRTVYSIHALLSFNLLTNPRGSGRIREMSVGISGTAYLPLGNPHLLKEYFELFIKKLNQIENPFEQSIFSIIHLSYLQAFEDVNKRTGRLVSNIPLIKKNLRPLSFTNVDQEVYVQSLLGVYEKNDISLIKDLYVWAYKQSSEQYSAVQQTMSGANLLKLKCHAEIQKIVRTIVLEKTPGEHLVPKIRRLIDALSLSQAISKELFKIVELEIDSLHDGNIATYGIRPSEFEVWKSKTP